MHNSKYKIHLNFIFPAAFIPAKNDLINPENIENFLYLIIELLSYISLPNYMYITIMNYSA